MGGAKLIRLVREKGPGAGLAATMRYLRANIFRYELEAYLVFRRRPPAVDSGKAGTLGLRFAPVELQRPETVDALVDAWPPEWSGASRDSLRRTIEADLHAGDQCYAYWQGERIAAASWVGFGGSPYLKKFAGAFGLADDEALRRTTFVAPGYRGNRLQVLLAGEVENHVRATRGTQRFLVYVGIGNTASLRNLCKVYEEVRPVYHARITVLGREMDWFPKKNEHRWMSIKNPANDPGT